MARPRSQIVEYFPHYCNHGKTMLILEQRYGNDGYAFWFKLLETIGATPGHCIDCGNDDEWEFLQAKTRLTGDKCREILQLLAKLNAIDKDLWAEKKVWSQNFVDGILPVYVKRTTETPVKPGFRYPKPPAEGVSDRNNRESRVEYRRVEESIPARAEIFPSGFESEKINSDSPLPPILQAEWDKLTETYPKPRGIIKGRDRAIRLFVKSAERARVLKNARHYSCSDDARSGFVMGLDKFVDGGYRDYDDGEMPLGHDPPERDTALVDEIDRDRKRFEQEQAAGNSGPRRLKELSKGG